MHYTSCIEFILLQFTSQTLHLLCIKFITHNCRTIFITQTHSRVYLSKEGMHTYIRSPAARKKKKKRELSFFFNYDDLVGEHRMFSCEDCFSRNHRITSSPRSTILLVARVFYSVYRARRTHAEQGRGCSLRACFLSDIEHV